MLRLLRVPSRPALPVGALDARVFRAASGYYRYRLTLWALKQLVAAAGLIAGLVGLSFLVEGLTNPWAIRGIRVAETAAWLTFLVQLPFSLIVLNLDFELRWYIVSDRSLRIREGVVSLKEKTMTYANVQNIEIRRNPLQRFLGIADVRVRSAGGGGSAPEGRGHAAESMHEAYFRGIDEPEQIRSAIAERVRRHRESGLGDPDDAGGDVDHPPVLARSGSAADAAAPPAVLAARELMREAALLRAALETSAPPSQPTGTPSASSIRATT